jgi:betaine-aldehyde dehydrogenase
MHVHHRIGGEWVDSAKRMESINPATGETIGTYTEAGAAEATRAIAAALKAFRETDWRKNRPLRAKVLNDMADRFEARAQDLVELLALENGKVKPEAQFELSMVPSRLRSNAALALADFGRAMETSPGRYATTLREAAGVAGIICAVELAGRAVRPIVAAGACRRLHHRRQAPWVYRADERADVRGLERGGKSSKGVVNVFSEVDASAARTMIDSPDVPVISFTGSSRTGQAIMAGCAKNMKRFGGELSGKTPVLLFDDADLDKALPKVEKALTVFAGQFCMTAAGSSSTGQCWTLSVNGSRRGSKPSRSVRPQILRATWDR